MHGGFYKDCIVMNPTTNIGEKIMKEPNLQKKKTYEIHSNQRTPSLYKTKIID
jgi:hypothetical protein